VRILSAEGVELGVSTTYGVVFLGSTASSGRIEIEAWFGDGPSLEPAVVEPLGGGLYTAEPEIRLPAVPVRFDTPRPGDQLLLIGRGTTETWSTPVRVRSDPRVFGILLEPPPEVDFQENQVGAGVFWVHPENGQDRRLVGLVSGRVTLARDGRERTYLAVVGPEDLWRLVTYHREHPHRRRWVYREDIM